MRNDLPPAYWMLAAQFLRLAHESCVEIINSGNKYTLVSDVPISPLEFSHAVRWSDHAVGAGVLFSYFHGIELILKGFLSAAGIRLKHHRLTELLKKFEEYFPDTDLAKAVHKALPKAGENTPMGRFLDANTIQIDEWYEALKYPESRTGLIDHFHLKFGGQTTISFWESVH